MDNWGNLQGRFANRPYANPARNAKRLPLSRQPFLLQSYTSYSFLYGFTACTSRWSYLRTIVTSV
jgi:hypothetical protein